MTKNVIRQFDDDARRRIGAVVRKVEREPRRVGKRDSDSRRGRQVCFGITVAGSEAYPSDPATVFNWKPVDRKPASLVVGDREITDTPWTEGVRKGTSIGGTHLVVGTLCVALKVGAKWWLQPIPLEACGYIPLTWAEISGWTAGQRQVLMHEPDACPSWVTVNVCET